MHLHIVEPATITFATIAKIEEQAFRRMFRKPIEDVRLIAGLLFIKGVGEVRFIRFDAARKISHIEIFRAIGTVHIPVLRASVEHLIVQKYVQGRIIQSNSGQELLLSKDGKQIFVERWLQESPTTQVLLAAGAKINIDRNVCTW
jgi:hypothetical protein